MHSDRESTKGVVMDLTPIKEAILREVDQTPGCCEATLLAVGDSAREALCELLQEGQLVSAPAEIGSTFTRA